MSNEFFPLQSEVHFVISRERKRPRNPDLRFKISRCARNDRAWLKMTMFRLK
jgi:hypothetical protein